MIYPIVKYFIFHFVLAMIMKFQNVLCEMTEMTMENIINGNENFLELNCGYDMLSGDRICSCSYRDEAFVLQHITGNSNNIRVQNCKRLHIKKGTFNHIAHLSRISFENIDELTVESHSLEFPIRSPISKIKITFSQVNINEILPHALSGSIDHIEFIECKIGKIRAFAVNGLNGALFNISIVHCIVDRIETQAFKKMSIENFEIKYTTILSPVPSRAFYDLIITDNFLISHCSFSTIASGAIMVNEVNRFNFWDNKIDHIEPKAFQMSISNRILIQRNMFKQFSYLTFSQISVDVKYKRKTSELLEFQFIMNYIQYTDYPIQIYLSNEFNLKVSQLKFMIPMKCDELFNSRNNPFLREFSENIYFKIGQPFDIDLNYFTFSEILARECILTTTTFAIISSVAILLLMLIIFVGIFAFRFLGQQRTARQMNVVMPEGKTYRETQIVMQIENAGLLKTDM